MSNLNRKIYLIGPSLKTQGGISSVLSIYEKNFKENLNLRFIASYSGKNRINDFALFAWTILAVFLINLFVRNTVFHIHVASKGSYLRKSILTRICLSFHSKVILHVHGAMFDKFLEGSEQHKKLRIIELFNRVERIIVLSESWLNYFSNYIPKEKLLIIYNPSSTYKPGFTKTYTGDKIRLLFMGRMGDRKGTFDLIDAVSRIKAKEFILYMYGDGELAKVKELLEKEHLTEIVKVSGWVAHSKINEIYDNADIMVLPSYAEGLPMSLLEGAGKGLAIVSTPVGGIPEIVEDGVNGYLIAAGDVKGLSEKLEELIKNPGLVKKMGRESLVTAEEKFSVNRIGQQLKQLYDSI